jgi:hypothetical protein
MARFSVPFLPDMADEQPLTALSHCPTCDLWLDPHQSCPHIPKLIRPPLGVDLKRIYHAGGDRTDRLDPAVSPFFHANSTTPEAQADHAV